MKNSSKRRLPVQKDNRTFQISHYLQQAGLSTLPESYNWDRTIGKDDWGSMHNMEAANCTIAAAGHMIMAWTAGSGKMIKPSDESIIHTYSALSGYNPQTGENDTGLSSQEVLKYWRKYFIHGHRIFAYTNIDWLKHEEVKQAIYLFGGCFAGLNLPASCTRQQRWELPDTGTTGDFAVGSWGGHAIFISGYSKKGLKAVTLGTEKWMSWEYWDAYCDEAYAILSESFIKDNKNPEGIDVNGLRVALASLKKG